MNNSTTKTIFAVIFVIFCAFSKLSAQVLPTTPGVSLFCKGSDLTLPAAPAGEDWIVKYSATQTTTPGTGVTLVSGKIAAADLNTGYYYLSSKSTTAGACESELQEIPVYVLKPLVVDFTPANFCLESPLAQVGLVTNPEDPTITTLAYQWYTVDGANETAISGAIAKDYTPSAPATVGTKKHRLKVGYVIGGKNYCPQTADHDITVTAKPTKPTITPGTLIGTATAVTF
ncbi:hypothetical protein EV200_104396 [Pedobacter psychrotolerans]|uniref:Uncharacterized protein n=1 Tax=Pedobacter psychrotolerans TaxID=1843235 RepID=A0A4R2HC95_9SPHI|nr:hypothetical protein [Pedobacter psychrotolerans]TCO25358.1 hypothetical protein EV200_104396 [Pedobacter psychrotolerans]GGE46145.1 hypothetical protein GCM10011413_10280 [Pedobacter psychrotolerans]